MANMNDAILPLLQELVFLNVKRWDVERRIEQEIFDGAELDFMGPIYENQIADLSVACYCPKSAYEVVKAADAKRFFEALKNQLPTPSIPPKEAGATPQLESDPVEVAQARGDFTAATAHHREYIRTFVASLGDVNRQEIVHNLQSRFGYSRTDAEYVLDHDAQDQGATD